ncbi:MAG TPA: CBS domain-containing protein [Myxococcales bacterium]|nr:CBS domain-containing protein [Myxococcales bacterium]
MRIADVMNKEVAESSPSEHAAIAWDKMRSHHIHHLVVLEGTQVVGVLSERDLHALDPKDRAEKTVRDLMDSNPVTVEPQTTLRDAANLLRGNGIGCLPVMEGDRLVGIVTTTDLLEQFGRGFPQHGAGGRSRAGRGPKKGSEGRTPPPRGMR